MDNAYIVAFLFLSDYKSLCFMDSWREKDYDHQDLNTSAHLTYFYGNFKKKTLCIQIALIHWEKLHVVIHRTVQHTQWDSRKRLAIRFVMYTNAQNITTKTLKDFYNLLKNMHSSWVSFISEHLVLLNILINAIWNPTCPEWRCECTVCPRRQFLAASLQPLLIVFQSQTYKSTNT